MRLKDAVYVRKHLFATSLQSEVKEFPMNDLISFALVGLGYVI